MASVRFNLKYKDKDKSPIFMCVYYGAFKIAKNNATGVNYQKTVYLKYYISESVEVEFWIPKQGRVQVTKKYPEYREINLRLDDIEKKTLAIIRELQLKDIQLGNEVIKTELDKIFRAYKDKTGEIQGRDLMMFIPNFITSSNKSEGTKKSYNRVYSDLQEFEKKKSVALTFDRIDIDFYNDFVAFLKAKDYAPNTIGTRIKVLKTFMNEAYERNLHKNLDFKKRSFTKPKEETSAVYLTIEELDKLFYLDLSNDDRLSNVRDWFLIASYTGLRFSDFTRLTRDNIVNDVITSKTVKTGTIVDIPLHTVVKSILEKHNYNLPDVISNQKFNKYIKEVCTLASIDEAVFMDETKGSLKITKSIKKCDLVSAHTARRSFATNAFLGGVPPIQIMKITGHKTEKAFMSYIKISSKENAKKLQMHSFFTRMVVKK